MKILITGATGMLGSVLFEVLNQSFEVFTTGSTLQKPKFLENYKSFDLKNDSYDELINWSKPDVIIHCAAITDGNYCKKKPLEAINVNGNSVQKLIQATDENVKLIYISTDAVFSSDFHLAEESDFVTPENFYGKSKELGEFFLLQSNRNYIIIRTTIVGFSKNSNKQSFVDWIVTSNKKNIDIELFNDVIFTPISIWRLSEEIKSLVKDNFNQDIYHIAGSEPVTKFDFGYNLIKSIGGNVKIIKKGSIKDFDKRANRSTDQSLLCSKYERENNIILPDIKETILELTQKYYERH